MEFLQRNTLKKYLQDRMKIVYFAIVVMIITTIPYLIGFASEGDAWKFSGFIIGVDDGNSYIAKMLSGANGDWLFRTPYSAETQKGLLVYAPYILLGKLASPPAQHDQLVVLYHGFRFVSGILAILAGYDFLSLFITKNKWRWWALIILALGGGGGWILVLIEKESFMGSLPLDFISPESFGYLSLLGLPHLVMARACFLWGFTIYLKKMPGYFTGILWLLLGFLQPIYVVVAWTVVSMHLVLISVFTYRNKKKNWDETWNIIKDYIIGAIWGFVISTPLIIYTAISLFTDPFFRNWAEQNKLSSPHFLHYLIAYGIFIPFVIIGLLKLIGLDREKGYFLAGWLILLPVLVNAPVPPQRRLAEGIWAAIIISAISYFENRNRLRSLEILYLSFVFPSTLLILIGSIFAARTQSKPIFRPVSEIQAFEYLAENILPESVILSSYDSGNNLPAWANHRVVLGHGPETRNRYEVEDEIVLFFSPQASDDFRNEIINKYN
ncbi:MAG: hypothetical protein ACTSQL_07560, partial [Promethearchaeota archaeon]